MENMEKLADLREEIAIKEMKNQIEIPEKEQEGPAQIPRKFQAIPYWQAENPVKLEIGNLRLTFYEKAGVLQIALVGRNDEGEEIVRSVSLRKDRLFEAKRGLFLLRDVFKKWAEEITKY